MPCNDFLHFTEFALLIDFTPRSMLPFDVIALTAPTRSSETRMNTGFSSAHDGPKRAVTFLLTRVRFCETRKNLARVRAFLETIPETERVRFPRAAS